MPTSPRPRSRKSPEPTARSRRLAGPRRPSLPPPRPPRPKPLPGISPRAFEHPADTAAMAALRKVPGLEPVARKLFSAIGDRSLRLAFLGSAVRVDQHQFPAVFERYRKAARLLDVHPLPELYLAQTPFVNAGAMGLGKPFIVLNSGSLDLLTEDELQFILGHELGHVLSGHALFKTVLRLVLRLSLVLVSIPVGSAALFALSAALLEWDRKSELSADRAGLLATQDPSVGLSALMKMAGGGHTDEMSLPEFLEQAREYEEAGNVADSVLKLLHLTGQSHPFPVLRLAELKRWAEGDEYERIVGGEYPRRSETAEPSLLDDLKRSAGSYRERFETSQDPLWKTLRDLLDEVRRRAGKL